MATIRPTGVHSDHVLYWTHDTLSLSFHGTIAWPDEPTQFLGHQRPDRR
jgi:hypothetical protein